MAWLALLLACFPDPEGGAVDECVACHGSPETGPAPPTALGGFEDPSNLGVGAHQAHVQGPALDEPVACSECHLWPASVDAEGHTDTPWPAEVGWGELGKTDGGFAAWDRDAATCTVYCHGVTLTGGTLTEPSWTATDGAASVCGSCHGNPPPPPHPPTAACAQCHGPLTPDTHIDGKITWVTDGTTGATTTTDSGTLAGCDTCHGAAGDPAPPPDTLGSSDTSSRGVGAHQIHLSGGATSAAVACEDCHVVPAAVGDPGHLDLAPAEVLLTGRAEVGGVVPDWDDVNLTCGVYCHGASLGGGSIAAPTWNVVDGSQAACGACHSLPPPAPHPANASCDTCHPAISQATHINGTLDF